MPTLRLRSRYVQVLFQHIIYISCPTRKLPAQHRSTTFRSQIMNIFDLPTNFNSDKQTPLQQHPWIPTSPKPLHPLRQSTSGNLTSPTASSASGTSPPLTDPSTGIKFNCCEQYMMYHKAVTFNDEKSKWIILDELDPREHKKLGRMIRGFSKHKWDEVKFDVVVRANVLKFTQAKALEGDELVGGYFERGKGELSHLRF